ncbi:acyl-homoserine-lactone synthase [Hyphomicrobiales bacterium 4NK60-0047b]|jgi:acyl homoserine lactone synthase
MIISFSQTDSHKFGGIMPSMYKLRYKQFVERQGYETFSYKNFEYDQYDTPAATYLVYRGQCGEVQGLSRLAPTDRPYMIKDLWPNMVTKIDLPNSMDVWESTRFCIDKEVDSKERAKIKVELLCAALEYGLKNGINAFVGVMPPAIWASVFIRSGWDIELIGDTTILPDNSKVVAAKMPVTKDILDRIKSKNGIKTNVLFEEENSNNIINQKTMSMLKKNVRGKLNA